MTVYFWTPDVKHPAGGVRVAYRFVDHCNEAGISAAVMHQRHGFRATWFMNATRVVAAPSVRLNSSDVLVLSELDAAHMLPDSRGLTKVILNQAHYWTFVHDPAIEYRQDEIASVIAVSNDGVRYLEYAFPGLKVDRVRLAVDHELFRPREPRREIVYLAAKGEHPRRQVLAMLDHRGVLEGWKTIALAGLTQVQLARRLSSAAIFLAMSESEGLQLTSLEAMAAGCAVVGYHGGGGKEFLLDDRSWPVPSGDVVTFAQRVEEVVRMFDSGDPLFGEKTCRARAYVQAEHDISAEYADVVRVIEAAVARASVNARASTEYRLRSPNRSTNRLRTIARRTSRQPLK